MHVYLQAIYQRILWFLEWRVTHMLSKCCELCFWSVIVLVGLLILFSFGDILFHFRSLKCDVSNETKSRNRCCKNQRNTCNIEILSFLKSVHNETSFHQFDQKTLQYAISLLGASLMILRCTYVLWNDWSAFFQSEGTIFQNRAESGNFRYSNFVNTAILVSFAVFQIRYSGTS